MSGSSRVLPLMLSSLTSLALLSADFLPQIGLALALLPAQPSQPPSPQASIRLPHPRRDVRLRVRGRRVDEPPCADGGDRQGVGQRSERQGRRQG